MRAAVPGVHARELAGMALRRHVSALHRVTGVGTPAQGALSAFRHAAGPVASDQVRAGPAPVTP